MKRVVCLLSVLGSIVAVEALPATHSLADGRLRIEVMDPTAPDRYNRGVRFTNVAAVLRATYAGQSFLYAPAKHDPIADHGGLASEFDLCIPGGPVEHLPPGWSAAAAGGGFLKIGVGVLEKKGKTYHLFHQPRLLQAADTTVVWQDSSAVFTQISAGSDGYAYELGATLTVRDPTIVIDWSLTNTGTKAFTTRTYTHNFLRLADRDAGPGYVLSFPYPITVQGALAEQTVGERDIAFTARIPTWVNMVVAWSQAYQGENTCTLSHPEAGLSLMCATSMPCDELAIHARAGYISPEQFIRLSLAPGDRATWTRIWTFNVR